MSEQQLKYFVMASIISADNDEYTEDIKQEIISRFGIDRASNKDWSEYNWEYILEPIGDKDRISKLIGMIA